MLSVDSVTKVYKTGTFGRSETVAVSDVSFSIAGGEIVALIGESGSGKTTLGKMILGLTPVTTGRITFDGSVVSTDKSRDLRQYYRHVQGVFQDPFSSYNPIFKADRVFGMVRRAYFPRMADSEWTGKLEQALEAVSLNPGDCLNKYPHQLSGGQLQRLLIARALLLDLRILVADEVISMLDASTRVDVLNLLANLSSRGLGIVFITHDLALGSYISDTHDDPPPRPHRRAWRDGEGLREPRAPVHEEAPRRGAALRVEVDGRATPRHGRRRGGRDRVGRAARRDRGGPLRVGGHSPRTFTARAVTSTMMTSDTVDSMPIRNFTLIVSGIVSVGLNALAFISDT